METQKQVTCSHSHAHEHNHNHEHGHEHHHGKQPILFFFIGVALYLVAVIGNFSAVLQNSMFVLSILSAGYHVMLEGFGETIADSMRLKKFHPNVHILMTLAAVGACIIGDYDEGALLILIFSAAHFLEEYAEGKSKREITNLLKLNPTKARRIAADGQLQIVEVSQLKIGDKLKVLPGDQVPTDGAIIEGASDLNEASITGESMPQEKTIGDAVFGSTVNGHGTFTMRVTKDSQDTVFAKIVSLVDQAQSNLSKTATTINRIEPVYVTIVLVAVTLFISTAPAILGWSWQTSFYRGMVMLVAASPCALAASAVPATLSGISNLAKRGVLFKGGSYLANLAKIKAVAFDKTGTLTEGKPSVTDVYFVDESQSELWKNLIVAMEKEANHPLADAILAAFVPTEEIRVPVENEIGKGLVATYNSKDYRIGKPSSFEEISANLERQLKKLSKEGKTVVFFSEGQRVVGMIALLDLPNPQAVDVMKYLKQQGIHTTMITGDAQAAGETIGKTLGIDEVAGNVLPADKAKIIERLKENYGDTAMLGDGVNDAPALAISNIGFAMGEGTDIAIDVADAVIMKNDLKRFQYAHRISKKLDRIVWQNMIFSMAIVALLLTLNILGKVDIGIGVLAHEGSTIAVILNGLRLLLPLPDKAV